MERARQIVVLPLLLSVLHLLPGCDRRAPASVPPPERIRTEVEVAPREPDEPEGDAGPVDAPFPAPRVLSNDERGGPIQVARDPEERRRRFEKAMKEIRDAQEQEERQRIEERERHEDAP